MDVWYFQISEPCCVCVRERVVRVCERESCVWKRVVYVYVRVVLVYIVCVFCALHVCCACGEALLWITYNMNSISMINSFSTCKAPSATKIWQKDMRVINAFARHPMINQISRKFWWHTWRNTFYRHTEHHSQKVANAQTIASLNALKAFPIGTIIQCLFDILGETFFILLYST